MAYLPPIDFLHHETAISAYIVKLLNSCLVAVRWLKARGGAARSRQLARAGERWCPAERHGHAGAGSGWAVCGSGGVRLGRCAARAVCGSGGVRRGRCAARAVCSASGVLYGRVHFIRPARPCRRSRPRARGVRPAGAARPRPGRRGTCKRLNSAKAEREGAIFKTAVYMNYLYYNILSCYVDYVLTNASDLRRYPVPRSGNCGLRSVAAPQFGPRHAAYLL
jgi:hypothetical protein